MREITRERKYLSGRFPFHEFTKGSVKEQLAYRLDGSVFYSEIKLDVNKVIGFLSPKDKQVFVLRDLEGLSIEETASVLGISSIYVGVSLSRARKKKKCHLTS